MPTLGRILDALRAGGTDPDAIGPQDLEPFEELHVGGRNATRTLAEVGAGERVLDVGSGLGGPARFLAHRFGCHVTALDLTEEFCRAAESLTSRTGLSDRVRVVRGDALDLPFPDAAFDLVWTQHVAMTVGPADCCPTGSAVVRHPELQGRSRRQRPPCSPLECTKSSQKGRRGSNQAPRRAAA